MEIYAQHHPKTALQTRQRRWASSTKNKRTKGDRRKQNTTRPLFQNTNLYGTQTVRLNKDAGIRRRTVREARKRHEYKKCAHKERSPGCSRAGVAAPTSCQSIFCACSFAKCGRSCGRITWRALICCGKKRRGQVVLRRGKRFGNCELSPVTFGARLAATAAPSFSS